MPLGHMWPDMLPPGARRPCACRRRWVDASYLDRGIGCALKHCTMGLASCVASRAPSGASSEHEARRSSASTTSIGCSGPERQRGHRQYRRHGSTRDDLAFLTGFVRIGSKDRSPIRDTGIVQAGQLTIQYTMRTRVSGSTVGVMCNAMCDPEPGVWDSGRASLPTEWVHGVSL